jgi:hypothetical protein
MTRRRVVVAFAFAPLVVPVVLLVLALIFPDPHHQWYTREVLAEKGLGEGLAMWMVVASLYSLPVAYLVELVLGIPLWLVFRHYRIRSVGVFAACGGLIGSLVVPIFAMWSGRAPETPLNPFSPEWFSSLEFFFIVSAAASAVLFWIILFSGRMVGHNGSSHRTEIKA